MVLRPAEFLRMLQALSSELQRFGSGGNTPVWQPAPPSKQLQIEVITVGLLLFGLAVWALAEAFR
jgi:hypothetical protein